METVIYECGCDMTDVGQSFEAKGVLVCPVHHKPTKPYDHPAQPFCGMVRLELDVEAESREVVQQWLDTLTETVLHEPIVRGLRSVA